MDACHDRVTLERPDVDIKGSIENFTVGVEPIMRDEAR